MALRPPLALAVGAALTLLLAGCREAPAPVATAGPAEYIAAVERLLDPPAQLASAVAERSGGGDGPAPSRERLDELLGAARTRLAAFRDLPLGDPVLRRQRDRLADAYARMIPRMAATADALAPGGAGGPAAADGPSVAARASLSAAAGPFLDSLGTLPSAAASSPSR